MPAHRKSQGVNRLHLALGKKLVISAEGAWGICALLFVILLMVAGATGISAA